MPSRPLPLSFARCVRRLKGLHARPQRLPSRAQSASPRERLIIDLFSVRLASTSDAPFSCLPRFFSCALGSWSALPPMRLPPIVAGATCSGTPPVPASVLSCRRQLCPAPAACAPSAALLSSRQFSKARRQCLAASGVPVWTTARLLASALAPLSPLPCSALRSG